MLYICIDCTVIYCLLTLARVRWVSPGKRLESAWNISGSSQVTALPVGFKGEGVGLCTGGMLETEPEGTEELPQRLQ